MKKIIPMKYWLLLSALFLVGCNLIMEDNLSKIKVDMLSPPNGYNTSTQTQTFVWDTLPSATKYRFQIVTKRFDFIEAYVLDTFITGNRLTLGLEPKEYQWRVIAYNNSSQGDYNTYDLTIGQDTSLANQLVNAIAPAANAAYTKDSVAFWWTLLGLADQYQLQVSTHPSFNSQTIKKDTTTSQDYIYLENMLGLGTFYWRIRAMRVGIDTTIYSAIQQFSINMTPIHQAPSNNSIQSLPLNINWLHASNVATDTLFLYYNNTSTTYKKVALSTNSYTFNSLDTTGYGVGTYYWQVKSLGNNAVLSNTSSLWQFNIN